MEYIKQIITNPDGTQTVNCIRVDKADQIWTKQQELTARAIEAFGTSA